MFLRTGPALWGLHWLKSSFYTLLTTKQDNVVRLAAIVVTTYNDNIGSLEESLTLMKICETTAKVSVVRVCRGKHMSLADEANQVPVTLSCTTVDSVQSTPHRQASRCWLSDRNSTFLWGHMWGSETKPQVACLTTLNLKQPLCNDNSLLCPAVK